MSGLKSDAQPLMMVSVSQRPYQYLMKGGGLEELWVPGGAGKVSGPEETAILFGVPQSRLAEDTEWPEGSQVEVTRLEQILPPAEPCKSVA